MREVRYARCAPPLEGVHAPAYAEQAQRRCARMACRQRAVHAFFASIRVA